GEHFDIHTGGVDHINVHHTNEIAQSEGATGKKWVNYWLHGEFLILPSGRMGKSKGNMLTLSALEEEGYDPLDYRYFLYSAHYRTQLSFSAEAMDAAKTARASLTAQLRDLADAAPDGLAGAAGIAPERSGGEVQAADLGPAALQALGEIDDAFNDDLNAPRALGMLRAFLKRTEVPAAERLAVALDADEVFGLKMRESIEAREELAPELAAMIAERERARAARDFARADELRDRLRENGVTIEDTPNGTKWKRG
ncbi:MAG: CysS/YqeB C-terminal domain-containing protein, partial [Spirochaetota bacterium]